MCAVPHAWRSEDKSVESGLCIYLSLGSRAGAQVPTRLALQESLSPEMSLTNHTFLLKNKKNLPLTLTTLKIVSFVDNFFHMRMKTCF